MWKPNVLRTCCIQELAKDLFDPDKFSGVFTSGGSGPPRWLDGPSGLTADRFAPLAKLWVATTCTCHEVLADEAPFQFPAFLLYTPETRHWSAGRVANSYMS